MIDTERLILRPCRESDKPTFVAILNTPAMMARLGGVRPPAEIDALIDKRIADQARDGHSYWAMELRATGELVGTCGVRIAANYPGTPVHGVHEIGWRVAEAYWGQGLAREAATATLAWAWSHTPARHVAAWTTVDNDRSRRLMERLGMSRRPALDFRRHDLVEDDPLGVMIVYAIDRPPL